MARFTSDKYIEQLREDAEKLRGFTEGLRPSDNVEFKHAWNAYLKCMNMIGNAISNQELHQLAKDGLADPKLPYKIIPSADSDTE